MAGILVKGGGEAPAGSSLVSILAPFKQGREISEQGGELFVFQQPGSDEKLARAIRRQARVGFDQPLDLRLGINWAGCLPVERSMFGHRRGSRVGGGDQRPPVG